MALRPPWQLEKPKYTESTMYSIKLYHGGTMIEEPCRRYVGGRFDYFDHVDSDKFGLIELKEMVEKLGHDEHSCKFWHRFGPNLQAGSKLIEKDTDVVNLQAYLTKLDRVIDIYVEHFGLENPIPEPVIVVQKDVNPVTATQNENIHLELETDSQNHSLIDVSFLDDVPVHEPIDSMHDSSDGSDCDSFSDSDYDMAEDGPECVRNIDSDVEFYGCDEEPKKNQNVNFVTQEQVERFEAEIYGELDDSDDFASLKGSDEQSGPSYPKFNPKTEGKNPDLRVELVFANKKEAKFAIESHCFRRGISYRFAKNDSKRLQVKCRKKGCSWGLWVSPAQDDKSWQIKSYNSMHNKCPWAYNNSSLKSGWLAKTFVKKLKGNPKLGVNEFRDEMRTTLKVNISKQQAYRAFQKAKLIIEGTLKMQFSRIRDYCTELLSTNPGSTVVLKLIDNGEGKPQFQRVYICFKACKEGFKACRKVVGVDGCFLKGPQGGMLLTAVGVDPNNNIYPISYAVVEGETKETWVWFLNLIESDLEIESQYEWTFMSDKQKGLIPAFEYVFPNADNRFCVRHLHSNMKKDGFNGLSIKNALWAAARATRIAEFRSKMELMKELDEDAYNWLIKKEPSQWSRAYFTTISKCDILLNNMCESFNALILSARDKPILTILETIRNLIMTRFQINRDKGKLWDGLVCPKILKILEKNSKEAGECIPIKSSDSKYQIQGPFDQHAVDVHQKSCSCRRWDLTGIPCKHAISAIWCKNEEPVDYVHNFYSRNSYVKAYEPVINPIPGPELWPMSNLPPPLPPVYENRPGRPKKVRKRQPDEPPAANPNKMRRMHTKMKCRSGGVQGHNSRTCKENSKGKSLNVNLDQLISGESQAPAASSKSKTKQTATTSTTKTTSSRREKLPVRSSRKNVGIKIGGSSNTVRSVNLTQNSTSSTPVIVKGGVNFITVSNLQKAGQKGKEKSKE